MKKLIALVLGVACILSIAVMPTAAIQVSDTPIPSPDAATKWDVDGIMYEGEPDDNSWWSNAFINEPSETYYGLDKFTATEVDGIPCVQVQPLPGKTEPYFDFNYYQFYNDEYFPSLICQDYPYFAAKIMYNENAAALVNAGRDTSDFVAMTEDVLGGAGKQGRVTFERQEFVAGEWSIEIIPVKDIVWAELNNLSWMDDDASIRQYRYYPFGFDYGWNGDNDATCYVSWMGFFKSEEEALAYDPYYVEPETEAPAPETEAPSSTTTDSAQTADIVSLTVAAAVVSLGLAVAVSKKR